jgi:hypothetical protein
LNLSSEKLVSNFAFEMPLAPLHGGGDGAHDGLGAVVVEAARAIQSNHTEALGQLLGRRGLPVEAADENHDTLLALVGFAHFSPLTLNPKT